MDEGWINGGYFVMEPKIFDYLKNDKTFLERAHGKSQKKQLVAFRHYSFWQCVDTIRDKEILEKLLKKANERKYSNYWRHWIYWVSFD